MAEAPYPNQLRAWREFRRMSQEELAERLGVSKASIGHWETGARKLTLKWLPQLAEILGASPGYILEHDPADLPGDILEIWSSIPEENRGQALQILQTFRRAS